ncbi:uncharacterized protein LOC119593808 isoform X2 [Penaeus monodon]|uniref:uncharacterized protein LOC119593808 isoform X2 n=1 Tax=Penaeus monodon TaxID=6687 RepID=UPI0018A71CC6|nr:uncharacterized protein LOC119593808 isoform X2 [Penaeus monodon]
MAAQGITFAALLLALATLTHAADTTHKDDARLFYDDGNYSVIVGYECLFFIGVLLLGLLLLPSFLGLLETPAQPYDYAPATGYGASARAYDERTTFSVRQLIEDALNKFQ